jgi:hypothetical protein
MYSEHRPTEHEKVNEPGEHGRPHEAVNEHIYDRYDTTVLKIGRDGLEKSESHLQAEGGTQLVEFNARADSAPANGYESVDQAIRSEYADVSDPMEDPNVRDTAGETAVEQVAHPDYRNRVRDRVLLVSLGIGGFVSMVGVIAGGAYGAYSLVNLLSAGKDRKDNAKKPPPDQPPATPVEVAATAQGTSSILVAWKASEGSARYEVHRGADKVADVPADGRVPSWLDTGRAPGTKYCYRVVAVNALGRSTPSNEACATTMVAPPPVPATPTGLSVRAVAGDKLKVAWNASSGATEYILRRRPASELSQGKVVATVPADSVAPAFTDAGLDVATQYCYTVSARNSGGESAVSDFVCEETFNHCRLAAEAILDLWVSLPEDAFWKAMQALITTDRPSFDCQWNMVMVCYRLAAKTVPPVLDTPSVIQAQVDNALARYRVANDTLALYQAVAGLNIRGREPGRDEKLNVLVRAISSILGRPPPA